MLLARRLLELRSPATRMRLDAATTRRLARVRRRSRRTRLLRHQELSNTAASPPSSRRRCTSKTAGMSPTTSRWPGNDGFTNQRQWRSPSSRRTTGRRAYQLDVNGDSSFKIFGNMGATTGPAEQRLCARLQSVAELRPVLHLYRHRRRYAAGLTAIPYTNANSPYTCQRRHVVQRECGYERSARSPRST
jgi:hypothetical protein